MTSKEGVGVPFFLDDSFAATFRHVIVRLWLPILKNLLQESTHPLVGIFDLGADLHALEHPSAAAAATDVAAAIFVTIQRRLTTTSHAPLATLHQ